MVYSILVLSKLTVTHPPNISPFHNKTLPVLSTNGCFVISPRKCKTVPKKYRSATVLAPETMLLSTLEAVPLIWSMALIFSLATMSLVKTSALYSVDISGPRQRMSGITCSFSF